MKAQQTMIIWAGRTWRIEISRPCTEGNRGRGRQPPPAPARKMSSGPGSDRGQAWGLSGSGQRGGWEGWACGRRAGVDGGAMQACPPLWPGPPCTVPSWLLRCLQWCSVLWLLFTLEMPREVEDDQDRMAVRSKNVTVYHCVGSGWVGV